MATTIDPDTQTNTAMGVVYTFPGTPSGIMQLPFDKVVVDALVVDCGYLSYVIYSDVH